MDTIVSDDDILDPFYGNFSNCFKNDTPLVCRDLSDNQDLKRVIIFSLCWTCLVIIVGTFANLLALLVILHQYTLPRVFRHVTMSGSVLLIINLAVADLIYCIVCLPYVAVVYSRILENECTCLTSEDINENICSATAYIRYGTALSEWSSIGLMALEKYLGITKYTKYRLPSRLFTPRKILIYCISIWVMGMALQLPTLFTASPFWQSFGYNSDTLKCDFVPVSIPTSIFDIRDCFFLVQAAIPTLCIIMCYSSVIHSVYTVTGKVARMGTNHNRRILNVTRSRNTICCLRLLALFLLCVMPMCIWNSVITFENLGKKCNQITGLLLYCLYWTSYAANNILYVLGCKKFRLAYKQLLHRLTGRKIELPDKFKVYFTRKCTFEPNCNPYPSSIECEISTDMEKIRVQIEFATKAKKKKRFPLSGTSFWNSQMGTASELDNHSESSGAKCVSLPCTSASPCGYHNTLPVGRKRSSSLCEIRINIVHEKLKRKLSCVQ